MLPEINRLRKASTNINVFRGLNRSVNTGFSRVARNSSVSYTEFSDMKNLCSDDYPQLSTRKTRASVSGLAARSNLLVATSKLIYVTEESGVEQGSVIGKLKVGTAAYTISDYQSGDHQLAQYGNNIIIMPEKLYFNLTTLDFSAIEFSHTTNSVVGQVTETVGNEEVTTVLLNCAERTTSSARTQLPANVHFRDFSIEKVDLDEYGNPRRVNYIYEKAHDLTDCAKQENYVNVSNPSQLEYDNETEEWQDTYYKTWGTINVGETIEAQGENPSGIYRCFEIINNKRASDGNYYTTTINGTSYQTWRQLRQFVRIENFYVKISRDIFTKDFSNIKKGDFVKISGMNHTIKSPLFIYNGGVGDVNWSSGHDWGNYIDVLNNNTFKVYYADESCIVIKANIDKSVPYTGPMTIERVMPTIDSGKMLEVSNRLWACSSTNNEIYSSKQGDCTNWQAYGDGIATDSFAVTCGTEGVFTGIARQNDSVIFFKENWIIKLFGTKPSNFTLASYNVLGVEQGSEKSIVWINGVLFYLSHMGVCQYSPGGQPVVISQYAFGSEKYKNGVGGRHRNKYYISAQNESGIYELFVFDTDTGLWHKEDNTQMVDTVTYNNVLYYIDGSGTLVCADPENNLLDENNFSDTADVEGSFDWSCTTGNLYEEDFRKKYICKIQIGFKAEEKTKINVYAQFRRGGEWVRLREVLSKQRGQSIIPVAIRRSDFLKLRVEGFGKCRISGMQIDYIGGSSKVWQS